jgi:endonuclease/exonuclease/phosphatase family metal-dependent hydrolase
MRLVSYNIQYGRGKDGRIDLPRIAAELRTYEADVIALQEVEVGWQRSGNQHQPQLLSNLLPGYHWVYLPAFDLAAPSGRRQFGNMVLARQPIWQARLIPLPKLPVAHEFNMDLGAIEVLLNSSAGPFRLYNLQLSSVGADERLRQIDTLLAAHHAAPARGGAWSGPARVRGAIDWSNGEAPPPVPARAILLGDFNAEPLSIEHARMMAAGFHDAWQVLGHAEVDGITYPAQPGWAQPLRIDYAFVTSDLAAEIRAGAVDHAATGADHNPLILDLDAQLTAPW